MENSVQGASANGEKTFRTLLVEDNLTFRQVVKDLLNYRFPSMVVEEASNGKEAMEIIDNHTPDLVLMDLKMPVMDGIEAFMKIQETPEIKATKVVFLTAFSDPRTPEIDIRKSKEIGAVDFIKKGISLDEFVERVKGYLA